jgi:phosphotriesterase-related protein
VVGLGRYIPRIQRIAAEVPELHIVVATGCYTYDDVPFFFHYRGPALGAVVGVDLPDPMVDMFAGDITDGIAGTGVKAAFLKCAIDEKGMTSGVARVMRAVAKAHRGTGAPITVHTHPGTRTGLAVKQLLCDEEGVDPTRVVLGHSGDSTDADHLSELAGYGFILGMDRFGINVGTTFEGRCDIVVELCRRGFADQLVLSQDAACFIDWIDPNVLAAMTQWNYLHIADDVLPYLRQHGVTDDQIDAMLVRTPRRYFEHTSPY